MDLKELLGKNVSTIFLVPSLGLSSSELLDLGMTNAYMFGIGDDLDIFDNVIYLCFNPPEPYKFEVFMESVRNKPFYISEDLHSKKFFVIKCKLDSRWQKDYDKIMNGRYSKVSEEYKKFFPRLIKENGQTFSFFGYAVVFKTSIAKNLVEDYFGTELGPDDEYWTTFDIIKETLTLDKLV